MVVVAIMGIVMTIAIPTLYRALHPDSMQKAVDDITEACKTARASAILGGAPMDLVFRAEDAQISVQPSRGGRSGGGEGAGAVTEVEHRRNQGVDYAVFHKQSGSGGQSGSSVGGYTPRRMSERIAIELMEVNFQDQMDFAEARVQFHPNGTCDEFRMVIYRPDTGERRLLKLEVVTGLLDVESDPLKFK